MKTKIITDSFSDISKDIASMYDIEVIPCGISLDGNISATDELSVSQMVEWIETNKQAPNFKGIKTSTFHEVFEKYLSEGMEIVFISSGSGSLSNFDSACHASTHFPGSRIHVFDSHHASGSLAMMVLIAANMAQDNQSANAIMIKLERSMNNYKHYGLTNTVEFLKHSGLCPPIVAVGVSLLNAKFEIDMKEDNTFDVRLAGTSMSKSLSNYFDNVFRNLKSIDQKFVFLMYTLYDESENYFTELYKKIEDLNYFEEIIVCQGGHHTTSLVGKGGVSVAYQLK